MLVVLRMSASPGFNDQVRIPAPENLTSGEFLCGSLSKDVLDCRRRFVIFCVLNIMQMNVYIVGWMPVRNRYENGM